jgi:8-oxo-dGTP diphosphatase
MPLFLVRHASAGERGFGPGDLERPLDEIGRARAEQLATLLAPFTSTVRSSPALRCAQTVAPLARALGVSVLSTADLVEGRPFEPVLDLLATCPDGTVMCSHGDVIPEVVDALIRRGMTVVGQPSWKKGSVWVLDRSETGEITHGTILNAVTRASLTS